MIILWGLTEGQIPGGWQKADGTNGTVILTEKYARGAPNDAAVGVPIGSDAQNHTFSATGHNHTYNSFDLKSTGAENNGISSTIVTGTTDDSDNKPASNQAFYIQKVA